MKSAKLIIVLTMTAIISGAILSVLAGYTQPIIDAYQAEVLKNAISDVLPGLDTYIEKDIEDSKFYIGKDKNGESINVAFEAVGDGFQSKLKILVGMDLKMKKILSIKILSQLETPGLGTKIEIDPSNKQDAGWWPKQFVNINASSPITYLINEKPDKSKSQVMAITGATISSKSVINIINKSLKKNRPLFIKEVN